MSSVKVDNAEPVIEHHVLPNLDYKPKDIQASKFKYFGVSPETASTFNLSAGAVTQTRFSIPRSNIYLFSRSCLVFDLLLPTAGANNFARCFVDRPPISNMRLTTRSGTELLNIDNFGYYWKMTRCQTPRSVYINNGYIGAADTVANAAATGNVCSFHNPGKDQAVGIGLTNNTKIDAAGASSRLAPMATFSQQIIMASDANAALAMRCKIPFGQLNGTILACPKDLPCTEDLILEIGWAPYSSFTFINTTAVDNLVAGLAAYAPANNVVLSALKMILCVEADLKIQTTINDDVLNNLVAIPFPYSRIVQKDAVAANTTKNSNFVITSQVGSNLLRVMSCEFDQAEANKTSHNAFNINGARTAAIKINVNGNDMDSTQSPGYHEDYVVQSSLLDNSAADEFDFYAVCPVTVTAFAGNVTNLTSSTYDDYDKINGADLSSNSVQFARTVSTSGVASNILVLAQGQKYLSIGNGSMKLAF